MILQHDDEISHPKGTGVLATLTFEKSCLYPTSEFKLETHKEINLDNTLVLYPSDDSNAFEFYDLDKIKNLIVLDGTWRTAKRILKADQSLSQIPKVHLPAGLTGNNPMRPGPNENYLSTFESSLYALEILDQNNYKESLNSLQKMNENYLNFKSGNF